MKLLKNCYIFNVFDNRVDYMVGKIINIVYELKMI